MWFQKQRSIDYKEIEEKEAGGDSKMEKLTKFLMEEQNKGKGGQKKVSLEDLIAKKKAKKKEMQDKTDGNWFWCHALWGIPNTQNFTWRLVRRAFD